MRNFIKSGKTLTLTAPYDVASGGGVKVGAIFGVAATAAASGSPVEAETIGIYDLKAEGAASGQAFTVGDAVYWDDAAKQCTKAASGNTKIGVAMAAKISTATLLRVRLNGSF